MKQEKTNAILLTNRKAIKGIAAQDQMQQYVLNIFGGRIMPTSTFSHIPTFCLFLQKTKPESFLDVGLGNGKMGFIARDWLDVMHGGRYLKKGWKVKIDGIEIFPDYIQAHQKAIYDNIYIGDALKVIDNLAKYDLIYIGDVLEHFTKEQAWQMLDKCAEHSNKHMLLSIPLGENWTQPEIYGNPYEEHKSFWSFDEFEPFVSEKKILDFPDIGSYGTFLIQREDFLHYRLREKADTFFVHGKREEAISGLIESLKKLPSNLASEFFLTDLFLKQRRNKEAFERLANAEKYFPNDQSIKGLLHQLNAYAAA
tara:strand:+ start:6180 stop:7112 length:933 start_codon:yes stop_codon:yes gene_type:complete